MLPSFGAPLFWGKWYRVKPSGRGRSPLATRKTQLDRGTPLVAALFPKEPSGYSATGVLSYHSA